MKNKSYNYLFAILIAASLPIMALARAGGGGSSSGGGGGHSSGGFSSGGGSGISSSGGGGGGLWIILVIFGVFFAVIIYGVLNKYKQIKIKKDLADKNILEAVNSGDTKWDNVKLEETARNIFLQFQKSWGEININEMAEILEADFNKRISLELSVLNNEGRRNVMENINIRSLDIIEVENKEGNEGDEFSATITASAKDTLKEIEGEKILFTDYSTFTETWDFIYQGEKWKLKAIHQATENPFALDTSISNFAVAKGFYYNPDFGWLMLPNKGYLFNQGRFGNTDINNHVVGYYRDKIVEFYTMDINLGNNAKESHLIAQAILPIKHNDILVRHKSFFSLFQTTPKGMRKHELESNDFIKEYNVYSDPSDNITTFELLNPSFMEMITKLPYKLNMEVVGNTLYLETEDKSVNYENMLEILSVAFDEMKM